MTNKARVILAGVAFLAGTGVGSCSQSGEAAETADSRAGSIKPTPMKTEVRVEYKDRLKVVSKVPDSCASALDMLDSLRGSEEDLMNVFIRGSDAMSDGHEALAIKDGNALNGARERLYRLDNESNDSAQELSLRLWPSLSGYASTCKSTEAYKEAKK